MNRIRQNKVCCNGNKFTMATKVILRSVSQTVNIPSHNSIELIIFELFTIMLWKAVSIPRNLVSKQEMQKLNKRHYWQKCQPKIFVCPVMLILDHVYSS